MKRAVRIAGSVLMHAALIAAVSLLLAMGIGPRTGAYRTLTVLSGSMSPRIAPGSVVVVTPEPLSALRPGQIITYQIPVEDHRVVTHRVVRIVEPGPHPVVQTKGDANAAPDPWLARIADDRVWRVRAVVPVAGRVVVALRSPLAHKLLVLVVPLLLVLMWIAEIWRRDEQVIAHA